MITFTTIDMTGEPLAVYQVADYAHVASNVTEGLFPIEGGCPLNSYYANGAWVTKPTQPDRYHQWDKTAKQWFDLRTLAIVWVEIRSQRDKLLASTDWVVTKAIETGEPMPHGWATYRQALRDITKQADPIAVLWPTPPN